MKYPPFGIEPSHGAANTLSPVETLEAPGEPCPRGILSDPDDPRGNFYKDSFSGATRLAILDIPDPTDRARNDIPPAEISLEPGVGQCISNGDIDNPLLGIQPCYLRFNRLPRNKLRRQRNGRMVRSAITGHLCQDPSPYVQKKTCGFGPGSRKDGPDNAIKNLTFFDFLEYDFLCLGYDFTPGASHQSVLLLKPLNFHPDLLPHEAGQEGFIR